VFCIGPDNLIPLMPVLFVCRGLHICTVFQSVLLATEYCLLWAKMFYSLSCFDMLSDIRDFANKLLSFSFTREVTMEPHRYKYEEYNRLPLFDSSTLPHRDHPCSLDVLLVA